MFAAVRRPLLRFVLAAIVVTVVLGLYAVIFRSFGTVQAKVAGTSAAVTAATILVLACLPALDRRRLGPLPLAGVLGAIVAFTLIVIGMWDEIEREAYWQSTLTVLFVGLWATTANLLSLARLAPRVRWVLVAAIVLALVLACLGIAGVWAEPGQDYGRAVAAVSILVAGFLAAVPVLHRSGRGIAWEEAHEVSHCPVCGAAIAGKADERLRCPSCSSCFRVSFLGREVPGRADAPSR